MIATENDLKNIVTANIPDGCDCEFIATNNFTQNDNYNITDRIYSTGELAHCLLVYKKPIKTKNSLILIFTKSFIEDHDDKLHSEAIHYISSITKKINFSDASQKIYTHTIGSSEMRDSGEAKFTF